MMAIAMMQRNLRHFPHLTGTKAKYASTGKGMNIRKWAIMSAGSPNQSNVIDGRSSGFAKHIMPTASMYRQNRNTEI
jgi:hypothetical protein